MNPDFTIVWDGTARAPMGRLLFAEDVPKLPPPAPLPRPDRFRDGLTARCRMAKSKLPEWFTAHELAAAVGCSRDEANHALGGLHRKGEIERGRKMAMVRRTYRWRVR